MKNTLLFLPLELSHVFSSRSLYAPLKNGGTREQIERVFGRPLTILESGRSKMYIWLFAEHSFNETTCLMIDVLEDGDGSHVNAQKGTVSGWPAWQMRWWMLKLRLGVKEML